jgi:Zn-dependent protease with chaperone function
MPTAAMDFFEHQDRARRRTKWLVFHFVTAVLLIIIAVYLVVLLGLAFTPLVEPITKALNAQAPPRWEAIFWQPKLFLSVAGVTILVIVLTSLAKVHELAAGGGVVARRLGGDKLDPQTRDPDERRLVNVVEEMAIASGMPVPEIYVLDAEKCINAFAAGYTTSDAVIGTTRGTVRLLNREELQGVVAHEFSHILNGDMRLNIRLMGLLHGILAIALIGRALVRDDSGRKKSGLAILGVGLLAVGSIGVFFGRLIKSAISRQREFLADAAAVQFTRYPSGLANALRKIGGLTSGSRLRSPNAEEASHLFFGNGLNKSWLNLMSTHPPLDERIRRVDPGWDGKFVRVEFPPQPVELPPMVKPELARDREGVLTTPAGAAIITAVGSLGRVGAPTLVHLDYARQLLASLPDTVKAAARISSGAEALIYALLLSDEEPVRTQQLDELKRQAAPEVYGQVTTLFADLTALGRAARLPLVELALPALRRLSAQEYKQFKTLVQFLVECDRQIDLFEYCLQKVLLRHLEPHFGAPRKPVIQFYALKPVVPDCAVVLSALARLGHEALEQREAAFGQGARQLNLPTGQIALLSFEEYDLPQIDQALNKLTQLSPPLKKVVLGACAHAVASDGVIQTKEAELLRAIADTLDCPMPPFVVLKSAG